ncbi:MAG TPA: CRISPR-associated helicase Cas3' [Syntrophobacteraceae bacterium]|nr:CRISPR-associated helicase Cas3' [Syntrophobacteraceae bacterium]
MPCQSHYAHSLAERPPSEWQPLEEHLRNVAERAGQFAASFGACEWGIHAGWLHDVGKYSLAFQEYLKTQNNVDASIENAPGRVDHSSAGAQYAARMPNLLGHLLAYVIAGHHSGLLDGRSTGSCQEKRLEKSLSPWEHGLKVLPELPKLEGPDFLRIALSRKDAFSVAFFVRMVFSCLVDADFLDTERFMNPDQAAWRKGWPNTVLKHMEDALTDYIGRLDPRGNPVDRQRTLVRNACLHAAERQPGLFSLSVPTGGGKTLASLAFALRHAIINGLQRVVYVVPLMSIIEQNAQVFRRAMKPLADGLGRDPVVEHHSNLDPDNETTMSRLAAENWDAPLVVTTSVQFYESLFANRTSRCRKLHRLARSVIILDEAQTLPVEYLKPCLRALQELTDNYRATVLLCTATQPEIQRTKDFEIGLRKPHEIIPDPVRLYRELERVRVENLGGQKDEELSNRLMTEPRVLCIVNTRSHAARLFQAIGSAEGHFHLSGNMCAAHRSEKLERLRKNLEENRVCRVISTQVIEAGVDVDFPVVYRALAGIDSIAQAAGRCNRNGKLPGVGRTYIFRSEHTKSERFIADTIQCAGQILSGHDNPLDLKAVEHYFKLYYWDQRDRWDEKKIMDEFSLHNDRSFPFNLGFGRSAGKFRLIDEAAYRPVIIPWGEEGRRLCERLRAMPAPTTEVLRRLQPFLVQVPPGLWQKHVGTNIQLIHDGIAVLVSPELHYSDDIGLVLDAREPAGVFV